MLRLIVSEATYQRVMQENADLWVTPLGGALFDPTTTLRRELLAVSYRCLKESRILTEGI
jgi:hypothetical protein